MTNYTIGYGGRTPSELLELLGSKAIRAVVDVRLRPDRTRLSVYAKFRVARQGIERLIRDAGIEYFSFVEPGSNNDEVSMPKQDSVLERILAFNDGKGGGVVVRKASRGYSLFREDDGRPVARRRPTGKGDRVEVMWWSHRDKWDQIGDFGPFVMPLDEALDYVSRDPMGIFWG